MTVNKYTILKVLLAAFLLTWLINSGRLNFYPLLSTSFSIFHVIGLVLLFCSLFVQGVRWWCLLKTQRLHLPFFKTIHLSWIGQFFSLVLPGVAGGELARGYYITREADSDKVAGLSTVLVDRVMGLYALLCLSIISLVFLMLFQNQLSLPVLQFGILNVILFSGISLLGAALLLHPTRSLTLRLVPGRYHTLVESTLKNYRIHMRDLLLCFFLSLLASIMALGSFQVAGLMVQTPLSWKQIFLVCPIVFITSTLPISPGGIGVGETAASLFFARFGVETGATIMLIVRIWLVILRLPGGLLYIVHTPRSPIEKPLEG